MLTPMKPASASQRLRRGSRRVMETSDRSTAGEAIVLGMTYPPDAMVAAGPTGNKLRPTLGVGG
jgi:hypothetical protein